MGQDGFRFAIETGKLHRAGAVPRCPVVRAIMQASASTFIQASRNRAWSVFTDTSAWPTWYDGIRHAVWVEGEPWTDGSMLQLDSRWGVLAACIRLVAEPNMAVIEVRMWSSTAVLVFEVEDSVGGCQAKVRETWHGPAAWLGPITRPARTEKLTRAMAAFRHCAEAL